MNNEAEQNATELDEYKVFQLHEKFYYTFCKQDYENEFFDVIFYVDGKELYAHAHILAAASPVFKELLLKNRSKGNGPIQIDDYTYIEFYEFLRLIYYNCYRLFYFPDSEIEMNGIIFAFAKLAHFYKAERIIKIRDRYKFDFDLEFDDVDEIFESSVLAEKYSVGGNNTSLEDFIDNNFYQLTGCNGFVDLEKSAVKA